MGTFRSAETKNTQKNAKNTEKMRKIAKKPRKTGEKRQKTGENRFRVRKIDFATFRSVKKRVAPRAALKAIRR